MRLIAFPVDVVLHLAYWLALAVIEPANWLTDVICGPDH
jgi:hypothetical protein